MLRNQRLKWIEMNSRQRVVHDHGNTLFLPFIFFRRIKRKNERRTEKKFDTLHVVHRHWIVCSVSWINAPFQHLHRFHLSTFEPFLPIVSEVYWMLYSIFVLFRCLCLTSAGILFNHYSLCVYLYGNVCVYVRNKLQRACKAFSI